MAHYFHRFTFSASNCAAVRRRLLVPSLRMLRFLWPQNNGPISVPISYLLRGVGTFFGLVNTPHQRHDLPLAPSRLDSLTLRHIYVPILR